MPKNTNNETNTTPEVNLENTKETAEQILNEAREEAAKIIADIKGEASKILSKAREEANGIVAETGKITKTNTNSSGLSEAELAEIRKNEEYVQIQLFQDNEKYKDDVYVAVGNDNCVIKRGVPVKIKRKFYLALTHQEEQDIKTSKLIEKESENYKEL